MSPQLGLFGYEVNTDVALINPDWDEFASQHDRRYGLAISYLKSVVAGESYDNEAVKLRVGTNGYYVQSKRFPAAFFGDTSTAVLTELSEEEARAMTWEAVACYRSGEAQSLTCLYEDSQRSGELFFGYRVAGRHRYEFGSIRSVLPLHLRVMIHADEPSEWLDGAQSGVRIYQRTTGGKHLLLRAAGRRQPFPGLLELSE
jgi:hypothetical protein